MKGDLKFMKTYPFTIQSSRGLHARPCASIAATAKQFDVSIFLETNGQEIDASNPIALMSAEISCGDDIILRISGKNEDEALKAIKEIINNELLQD